MAARNRDAKLRRASGEEVPRDRTQPKSVQRGRIKLTQTLGEFELEMGDTGPLPRERVTLFAKLVEDGTEWALILIPEFKSSAIQLTSLCDGQIMVKVKRR